MEQIIGSYLLEKNENLNEYFQAMGMPWVLRKMICSSTPTFTASRDADETWHFKTVTLFKTIESGFKLGEEYTETFPNGDKYQTITILEGENRIISKSKSGDIVAFERHYHFDDSGVIMVLKSVSTEIVAKRYFKRIQ